VNRSVAIGLVGVVAIVLALALTFWRDADEVKALWEAMDTPRPAAELQREPETKSDETKPTVANTPTKREGNSGSLEKKSEGRLPEAKSVLPSFDVVRVNPAGDAVIAGRATPGAKITILDGDVSVGTVTADVNGEWVLVPEKPLPSGNRVLSILAVIPGGDRLSSENIVVLAVPQRTKNPEVPLAVLLPREGKETKKILQRPKSKNSASRNISLKLDIVDYDEAGQLRLLGQANPGNIAIVYLNNASVGKAEVAVDGKWELRPESPVAPGFYTLRVDELKSEKVIARLELPFSRAAPIDKIMEDDYVIVQPGNSLWRISRRILGQGTMYSVIYEANKDQIRDPHLIHPGQVFAIPKTN